MRWIQLDSMLPYLIRYAAARYSVLSQCGGTRRVYAPDAQSTKGAVVLSFPLTSSVTFDQLSSSHWLARDFQTQVFRARPWLWEA
eukprot:1653084-Rhodomonas_salina.2